MRHHTTRPIQPIRRIAPVHPVAPHRRGAPAGAMLQRAVQFYRRRLRALAAKARPQGADTQA